MDCDGAYPDGMKIGVGVLFPEFVDIVHVCG